MVKVVFKGFFGAGVKNGGTNGFSRKDDTAFPTVWAAFKN